MSQELLLTISILISNRPDTVRKCLDSIQPLLEAIPSELILTDTGCGEQVRSIIEEYTDHIIDFEWCRDFSKARNAGLKQAKGKWFLFLDDDEWFEDVSEIIEFFNSGEYKKYGFVAYTQRNYLDRTEKIYTDLAVGRMVRLDPGIEFMYSIHECFNRVPGKVKRVHSYVHHYGYAYKTEEERMAHSERNISLLLVECEAHPENMKHALQLAQEYNAIGKREDSLRVSLDSIEYAKHHEVEIEYCLASLYGNVIECYMELKQQELVLEKGEEYLRCGKIDPLVEAMICGILSRAYLAQKDWETCLQRVRRYEALYGEQLKQEDIYLVYTTSITADCFEQRNRSIVMGVGVIAAMELEQSCEAKRYFGQIDVEGENIFISKALLAAVVNKVSSAKGADITIYVEMCNTLAKRAELLPLIVNHVRGCKEKENFALITAKHWYFTLLRIIAGKAEASDFLEVWKNGKESLFDIVGYKLWEFAEENNISQCEIIENIPLYLWREIMENYCNKASLEQREQLQEMLEKHLSADTWHYAVWQENYLYAALLTYDKHSAEQKNQATIQECWFAYGAVVYEQAVMLYREEIIQGALELLPAKVQMAVKVLYLAELMEQNKYTEAVAVLKELQELVPQMSAVIKACLNDIQENVAQQKEAELQLAQLTVAVKAKVKEYIAAGNYPAAEAVLKQLELMLPDDKELVQLREEINK